MGMPTQAMAPEQIRAVYGRVTGLVDGDISQPYAPGMPAGSVTDDTEQALLIASLLVRGRGVCRVSARGCPGLVACPSSVGKAACRGARGWRHPG